MGNSDLYYMKDEVYFEPLFNYWYAWPYIISPAQASRYTSATHLRLMKSFVRNHELHIIGSKQLVGGEFLACTKDQIEEIKKLIDSTETNHKDLLDLSKSIDDLNELLRGHQSGESIEPLYSKIPERLKGYVELFMDLEHNPSYRILESLLYKSEYYKEDLQSVCFGLITKVDERPFILSTPRLPDENHLRLNLSFNSPYLKTLLETRDNPLPMSEIDLIFGDIQCEGGLNYRELFTNSPRKTKPSTKEKLSIHYIGHAGFLIQTPDTNILIDPVITCHDERDELPMMSYSDLPDKIDYICLTHSHSDHTQIETLLQLRHKTNKILVPKSNSGYLSDPSLKLLFKRLDFEVSELEDLDEIDLPEGKITAIPFVGEHGDLNIRSKTAWHFELAGKKLFFGADSTCLDKNMYTKLHKLIGDIDVLAIGTECVGAPYTWLYGALYSQKVEKNIKESRRLNGCDSVQALSLVEIFNPKQVYIYALGAEPCYKYFMGLEYNKDSKQIVESNNVVKACEDKGIIAKAMIGSQKIEFV